MADKDFRIDLILGAKFAEGFRALDEAKKKLEGVDKAVGKFGRGAGNAVGTALSVTAAAGVLAATAATAVMGLYIARTIEAEKVQAQLASRLKDTAGAAGRSLDDLNNSSKALSKVTVFDDEAIGGAQAMLLTFREIKGVQFDKATEAVLNLSTAMGTDLNSAALQVGKALQDPVGGISALSRAGVKFTDKQKALIKSLVETGQTAKAQEIILSELGSEMGTAARAARDTLGGALQALRNSFDDLMEGNSGDSGIVGTRAAIESLIKTLDDPATKSAFDAIISAIVGTTNALINGVGWWVKWGEARGVALSGGDISGTSDTGAQKRLDEIANQLARQEQTYTLAGKKLDVKNPLIAELLAERDRIIEQLKVRNRKVVQDQLAQRSVDAAFDSLASSKPSAATDPAAPKPKKTKGTKSDPDADIKRRTEGLREEFALLGLVAAGEEKASEAAKARYDITEGEFKNKSPQLKAEYLAAAEALDAKNKDTEAEKKRLAAIKDSQDAYRDLMKDLRTPAQVAVDDAIAKLNTLTEAMKRGEAGPDAAKTQKTIIDGAFKPAPDTSFGGYDPASEIDQKRTELQGWYEEQLGLLADFRSRRADLIDEADRKEKELESAHQAGLLNIQQEQHQLQLAAASSVFGSLADIARNGVGEQSKAYQVLFAISKGFAIAQAATSLAINVSKASEKGFPENLPLIAAAFAQGAQIVAILSGASYGGGAGQGYSEGGYTGSGGKYEAAGVVHKGEGVLSQEEIAAMGGPAGFYRLRTLIDEGEIRRRMYGWAGYADGGFVGENGPVLAPPDYASYPQGAAGLTRNTRNDMRVYLSTNEDEQAQRLASHPAMARAIVAVASENGHAIKASWDN